MPDIPSKIHDFFEDSQIPLTLSDPQLPDDPLILANKAFYRMTGYRPDEALGANCRFMQGPETQKASRDTIRGAFAANRDSSVLIRNYRKTGETFDNYLYIFTVLDKNDQPIFRIGSQFEVPAINRAKAFDNHASTLLMGIEKLNNTADSAHRQMVNTGQLVGATVKSLLMARLENLRSTSV